MTKRAGMSWRLLAHQPEGYGYEVNIHSSDYDRAYRKQMKKMNMAQDDERLQPDIIQFPSQFDELVVDRWLHIEQMDSRAWWMQIGDHTLWVKVNADGTGVVTMIEKEDLKRETDA